MFNYHDWLPEGQPQQKKSPSPPPSPVDRDLLERAVQAVEAAGVDLTGDYGSWCRMAFAFASLGEEGRHYFLRISQFHPGFSHRRCNQQFNYCLRSKGSGISLGTFFYYVKQAGISIGPPYDASPEAPRPRPRKERDSEEEEEEEEEEVQMPVFPESVYEQLPEFLRQAVAPAASSEEKDLLLLGSLGVLSAVLPGFYGIYDGMKLKPNLYLFVTAPASAGKGRLSLCKNLLLPLHWELREQSQALQKKYEEELTEYNLSKGDKGERPTKPAERMLFIPANNSSTGFFQLLFDNEGEGLMFENEGDTLSTALRTEYGNFSDGFRKAWQHESISYYRRTDREYVEIELPSLSAVLSGTPRQVGTLIPSAENGLFSRFIFYYMNLKPKWKDVFATEEDGLEKHYLELGQQFFRFYKTLSPQQRIKMVFSPKQKATFLAYFGQSQNKYLSLKPRDYTATVRRMGVNCFRIAMILTALRGMEEGSVAPLRHCDDRDFSTALQMAAVLLRHSSKVYAGLPLEKKLRTGNIRSERFLDQLPKAFTRQEFIDIAQSLDIPIKTAEKYITRFIKNELLERTGIATYENKLMD